MIKPLPYSSIAIVFLLLLITVSVDTAVGEVWSRTKTTTTALKKHPSIAGPRARRSYTNKSVKSNTNRFDNSITTSTGATVICSANPIILTANPAPNGATYIWTKDGSPIAGATSSTYSANAAGVYFVTVTTAGTPVDYPSVTLTTGVNPVASFTHTADQGCSSSPIGFTSTTPGSNLTYAWDFGDPNSGANNTSTLVNPNHKFIGTPGDASLPYTVRLTVTNSDGCSNTTTQTLTMKQRPGTQLGNATEYNGEYYFTGCGNGPTNMTFSNFAASQSTNTSYTIKWGDGTTDFSAPSFNTAPHTFAIGTYNLSFIVTGTNGCTDTAHYKVFIGSNPAVGLGNPGNTSICTSSSLTFPVTNTQSNPPGTTYTVLFNDGSAPKVYTSPPDTITHYFNRSSCGATGGTYPNSFSATIIASNPCSSSQAVVSPIYVSQKAQASFSANKTITCAGNTITFTNNGLGNDVSNGGCTASRFVWTISPTAGWTATASALGNDFGQASSSSWQSGQNSLPVRFADPGTYTIKLKIGNTNCGSDEITKTICVNPAPIASFTTDVTGGCGPLTVTTTNTSPSPNCGNNTYQWSVSPSTGFTYTNGTNATSASPVIVFNNAGSYTLSLITINSNGDCTSTAATKTINIITKPTVSPISAASSLCEGSTDAPTATVNSTDPNPPTYLWTFGGGTPATSNSLVPGTITYSAPGNYTTTLAVTNSCGTTTVTKTINITARPTMTQPSNGQFCAGDPSGIISFTGSPGATFTWTNNNTAIGLGASGTGNIPSFATKNTTNNPIVATITVTPSNGCAGTPVTFTITVNAKPTTATTGTDTQTCGTTFQLNGNTPTIGTGIWTQTTGPAATISDVNAPNATVSNLTKGTRYQWTWTISNGSGCPPSAKTFTLDVLSDIVNTIKSDVTAVCPGQSAHLTTDILSGGDVPTTLPASYSYTWESSADGINNWTPINGATAPTLTTTPSSTISYRRKVRSFNQCEVISNVITIGLNAGAPAANAGSPISVCNQAQAQLNGNDPGVNFTGNWTDDATGSALTFSPDAHTYNATVSGLTPGQIYHLTWTITSVSCGSTTSRLTITDLLPLTNSITPSAATICNGQNTTIGGPTQGGTGSYTYTWESSTDQNTWSVMIGQVNANLNISPTQNTYYRRTVISGTCNQVSNAVQIIVLPPIANNTISASQQVCIGQSISLLNGSLPTGGDGVNYAYQWQQSIDNINWTSIISATGQNYQPVSINQSIYYRRLVTSGICTGGQQNISASVKITVNPNAKAEFTASSTAGCIPFDLRRVITSIPHDDVNSTYTWFANGSMIGTGSTFPGYTINTDGTQVVIKLVTVSKFGCDTSSMSKTFTTTQLVSASFTKDQIKGCGPLVTQFTNTSNPIGGATYNWNFGNGSTSSLAQPAVVTFQPNPFGRDTTYIITLKAATSCGISTFKDSVTVRSKPKAIFTPDKTTGCSPFTINITNQSRGLPNNYTFSFGNGDKITRSDNQAVQYVYTTTKTDTLTLKLVAENECGKDSSSYRIVVYPNTVQANLVVNGDNKSGCAPFTVKFDNNSTGANTFSYDFGDGTMATTSSAPETISHTFTKGGVYSVKMTASNGCSIQSTIQTITVLAAPQVAFAMSQLQYCVKEPVLFTNQTANTTAYNYVWDFGDGKTSNNVNPQHSYISAGIYKVALTAIQTAADGTLCSNTTTQIVTILSPPVATFSSNVSTLNCAPFNYIVASTPGSASGASWQFGEPGSADNTAAGFTASHLYTKAGIYKVQLLVYNQNGCADTSFQVVKITESPQPRFVTADTVLCGNSASISFKNNTTYGGSDPVSYKWFINDIQVSTQKDLSYTFNVPSGAVQPYTYKVKLQASSTIGCSDTEIHTMRFNPLPVAKFSVPSNISCVPFALAINNTSQYADQFQWFLDGQLVSTDKIPAGLVLKIPNKTYVLKLIAANIYGCQQDQFSVTFSTYPKPTAAFSLTDSVSCNGKLDINVTNKTTGAVSYVWNFGDGSPEQTGLTPSHTYGVPGTYSLSLVASNGTCRDTVIHHLQIAATPKASFVASVLKGCTTVTTTFQNLSVNSNSFLWDFGDGTFSTSKNPTHTYTYVKSPFTVKLSVIGDYGCTDETVLVNYITVTAPPVVDFIAIPDSVIQIPDHTFTFKNNTTGAVSGYNWDFGDEKISTEKEPSHTYADAGTFQVKLTAINPDGCSSFRIRTVKVDNVQQYLYVPNAFEPGSAKSELKTFNVRALGLKTYSLRIFNKWGQLLYETTALDDRGVPTNGWNGEMQGQLAPLGVYIWRITAFFLDGTEWHGMKYKNSDTPSKTGILHLIR